ncbi:MAG: aspartate kinase [Bdellovibrionota bacterium]|nr:aspartate kinase [Bdellovibrionota bacterium]
MKALGVAKFGGTSVRDAEAIRNCVQLVKDSPSVGVVVVSATSQTTNHLENVASLDSIEESLEALDKIWDRHFGLARDLGGDQALNGIISDLYGEGKMLVEKVHHEGTLSLECMDQIYSLGERLSSALFTFALESLCPDYDVHYWDARHLVKTNSNFGKALPIIDEVEKEVQNSLVPLFEKSEVGRVVIVTQGFIGSDTLGRTTTLGREGSDFSAALLAAAIEAKELCIWTDVKGILTTDPRLFSGAKPIPEMNYEMATKVARLGAKVLFPETLAPVQNKGIPVFVGHSLFPHIGGTWIKKDANLERFFSMVVKKNLFLVEDGDTGEKVETSGGCLWLVEKATPHEVLKKVSKISIVSPFIGKGLLDLESLNERFFLGSLPFFVINFKDDILTFLVENDNCESVLEDLHRFLPC